MAFVVYTLVAVSTLGTVKIGGTMEHDIAQQSELIGEVAPPAAFLVQTELAVMETRVAADADDAQGVTQGLAQMRQHIAEFRASHEKWQAALPADSPALEPMTALRETGNAYIEIVEQGMIPAIERGDLDAMHQLEAQLDELYGVHEQAGAEAVSRAAAGQRHRQRRRASRSHRVARRCCGRC